MLHRLLILVVALSACSFCQTYKFSTVVSFPPTSKQGPVWPDGDLTIDGSGNLYGESSYGGTDNLGTVFEVSSRGTLSVRHSFVGSSDGVNPYGILARDKAGNLYGITDASTQPGTQKLIFKLTPSGVVTTLYLFPTGTYPALGLALDSAGNVYGTTSTTPLSYGNIYKITPEGIFSVLYNFCSLSGCADGYYPNDSLIIDKEGNLYGTTFVGGNDTCGGGLGCGTIYKLTPQGAYTVLYTIQGGADGLDSFAKLTQDQAGNLYGVDSGGVLHGLVFKLTQAGAYTVLYSFCQQSNCTDGADPAGGVTLDNAGNIYGVTAGGGNGNGVVYKISPSGTETVLWEAGTGGAGRQLVMDRSRNLYGTTLTGGSNKNGSVYKLTKTN